MIPTTSAWNNPIWPVKKTDGSWRMTVDYRELNKVTLPLTAAVLDTVTLIERIQSHHGTWSAVTDGANAFFTIPIDPKQWEHFAFTWQGRQYTFTRLPQGYKHSPAICHRLIAEHLDECEIHPSLLITHYIDDILIQGPTEDSVKYYLELIVTHLKLKGWEINPDKIQGPAQEVKFLGYIGILGIGPFYQRPDRKFWILLSQKIRKKLRNLLAFFGYWRTYIPHLGQILQSLYKVTRKKYEFDWGSEQAQAFEAAKATMQASLDLWPI